MGDGRGIVINCRVVSAHSCGLNKLRTVARCVRCHRTNEADKVVCAYFFVTQDLERERHHDLPDSREVGVRRLAVYWLELFERIGEFCHDLFRGHGVWSAWLRERFVPIQSPVPSSLALISHRIK